MRPTSVERRMRPGRRGFAARVGATIGALALLVALLAGLSSGRGPQLRGADIDAAAAGSLAGQRLVLRADQLLEPVDPESVRIEPAAEARITTVDNAVVIEFREALAGSTDYRVEADVVGARTGLRASLTTGFTTPHLSLTVLRRDTQGLDRVVRTELDPAGPVESVVLEAPRIQEFAIAGDYVLAVSLDAADRGTLIEPRDGTAFAPHADAPAATRYRLLRGSGTGGAVGFVADGVDGDDGRLHLIDVRGGGARVVVDGLGDGAEVVAWTFVPGTDAVLVQTHDRQVALVDPLGGRPMVPLGQHDTILGFVAHSNRVLLESGVDVSAFDLVAGERAEVAEPIPADAPAGHRGRLLPLGPDEYAQVVTVNEPAGESIAQRSRLHAYRGGAAELLLAPDEGRIGVVCRSPNAELLVVHRVPDQPSVDAYPLLPGFAGSKVEVIRARDGARVAAVPGMLPSWCAL